MNSNTKRGKTLHLTQLALLTAILLLMAFTPLGYLKIGALSITITFLTIPVVIGATAMGPIDGAFLGLVFGITSYAQCFGMDAFGTTLCGINPFYTAVMCIIPRVLIGPVSSGLLHWLNKVIKTDTRHVGRRMVKYMLCCLAGALTNTVLFVGLFVALFGQTEFFWSLGNSVLEVVGVLVTVNAVVEALVCTFVGGAIAERLNAAINRMN